MDGTRETLTASLFRNTDLLLTHPTNQNKLIACSAGGGVGPSGTILRSEDGFATYVARQVPFAGQVRRLVDACLVPRSWAQILVSVDAANIFGWNRLVWRTTDGGVTWADRTGNAKVLIDALYGALDHWPITITTS